MNSPLGSGYSERLLVMTGSSSEPLRAYRILTAFAVVFLVFFIDYLGFFEGTNRRVYDLFFRIRGPREVSSSIVMVAIDEKTLRKLGRWPIDRKHYADLLDRLGSAEIVAIDIIMAEETESDPLLAEAMKRHGRVILPVYIDPNGEKIEPRHPLAPSATGHVHFDQDVDGIAREVYHTIYHRGLPIRSFASATYDALPGRSSLRHKETLSALGRDSSTLLQQADPMTINYYGRREAFRRISFSEVIEGRYPQTFFKGKIVLVGLTAACVEGEILTPFTEERGRIPGVELHAHILNNLIDGTSIRRLDGRILWVAMLFMSMVCFFLCGRLGPAKLLLFWLFGFLGVSVAAYLVFAFLNVWMAPAPFFALFSAACVGAYVIKLQEMRASLLQAKRDWEESFDTIDDAIVVHGETCDIARLNRAAAESMGSSVLEILKRKCLLLQDQGRHEKDSDRSMTIHEEPHITVEELYDAHANRHYEIRSMARRGQNERMEGAVHVVRDVTRRKLSEKEEQRLQSMLIQAQKMEAIGTLAGGVAHDFNNILAAMIGYTELGMKFTEENPIVRQKLYEVLKAGNRAKELVQQILNLSRQSQQDLTPLRITPLIDEVLQFLRATLPKTIEIRKDLDVRSDSVLSNPTHLHQILMNLCTNAAHAMRERGGVLEVSLKELDLTSGDMSLYPDLNPGPYLKLSVSDTGHGMERPTLERIFDPYFTTKAPGEGTGMGLAVVQRIIKSHKGSITVYSEAGKGTFFHVYLPRIMAEGEPEAVVSEPPPEGHERVLFVDDEETLAYLGKEVLESLGYDVVSRTNSAEALKLFEADPHQFDLIISDQTMPYMTGMVLAGKILEIRPEIPIILCTGYSEIISREKAKEMGIRAFLMKPLLIRELAVAIRSVLDSP